MLKRVAVALVAVIALSGCNEDAAGPDASPTGRPSKTYTPDTSVTRAPTQQPTGPSPSRPEPTYSGAAKACSNFDKLAMSVNIATATPAQIDGAAAELETNVLPLASAPMRPAVKRMLTWFQGGAKPEENPMKDTKKFPGQIQALLDECSSLGVNINPRGEG